ncbi:MAG: hypothetical protein IPG31_12950 [Nitrosomonas sp.]|nr:hypothetical protein [Nitrosomonas sp.]
MNLLRVGAILRIPAQQEIASISPKEAVREVRTQTVDWHAYRQRVADMASGLTSVQSQQSASGKITSVTDESDLAEGAVSQEVLRLSKGELLQDKQPANAEATKDSTQQYQQMMEEDAIAEGRALREANERVSQLEQNVNRLQRLMQLKDEGIESTPLEQLSKPVLPSVDSVGAEAPSVPVVELTDQDLARNSVMPEFTIPAQSVTDPLSMAILEPGLAETDEFAWLDELINFVVENIMLVGGGLAALLATWLGVSMFRRRQEQAEMEAYNDIDDYEVIGLGSDSEAVAKHKEEAADPSGFYRDAEKGESEGVTPNPAFFFGKKLDENPFTEEVVTDQSSQINQDDSTEISRMFQDDIKININSDDREEEDKQLADIMVEDTLDKWRFPNNETHEAENAEKNIFKEDTLVDEVVTPGEDNQIDFESGYSDYTEKSENKLTGLGEKFAHIDLNLGDASAALPAVDDVVETENDHWQEVATKIDLAKAYLEMEDWDGAREILQEVLQEGDVEQQTTARTMLSEIGG